MERDWRQIVRSCLGVVALYAACLLLGLAFMAFLLWMLEMTLPGGR